MKPATVTRIQIAVAAVSFASMLAFAATSPAGLANEEQSFIGTTPNATVVEEQPATF